MTIWTFPFEVSSVVYLQMPIGARPLTVQLQRGIPTLWAEVNEDAELEEATFRIIGTGRSFRTTGAYVGTWQQDEYVWHLYGPTSA